jgi:hypothetical protein
MATTTDPKHKDFLTKVVTKFGLDPKQQIDVNDPMTKLTLAIAITSVEQGRSNYSYDQYVKGIAKSIGLDPSVLDKELNPTKLGIENNSGTSGFVSPSVPTISTGGASVPKVNISAYISASGTAGPLPTIKLPDSISSAISGVSSAVSGVATSVGNAVRTVTGYVSGTAETVTGAVVSAIGGIPTKGQPDVAVVGDSLAVGLVDNNKNILGDNNPNASYSVEGGKTASWALNEIKTNPDLQGTTNAVFSVGSNDAVNKIPITNFTATLEQMRTASGADKFVWVLPAQFTKTVGGQEVSSQPYIDAIKSVAAKYGDSTVLVSPSGKLAGGDGIHPGNYPTIGGDIYSKLIDQGPTAMSGTSATAVAFNPEKVGFTAQTVNANGTTSYTNPVTGETITKQTNGTFTDAEGATITKNDASVILPEGTVVGGATYDILYKDLPYKGAVFKVTDPYFVSSDGSGAYREITSSSGRVYYQDIRTGEIYNSADEKIGVVEGMVTATSGPAGDVTTVTSPTSISWSADKDPPASMGPKGTDHYTQFDGKWLAVSKDGQFLDPSGNAVGGSYAKASSLDISGTTYTSVPNTYAETVAKLTAAHTVTIDDLRNQINNNNAEIVKINDQRSALINAGKGDTPEAKALLDRSNALENDSKSAVNQLNQLNQVKSTFASDAGMTAQDVDTANQLYQSTVKPESGQLASTVTSSPAIISPEVEKLQAKATDLVEQRTAVDSHIQDLVKDRGQVNGQIDSIRQDLFEGKISPATADLAIAPLQERADQLGAAINSATNDWKTINGEISQTNTQISNILVEGLNRSEANIILNAQTVAGLKDEKVALQAQLDANQITPGKFQADTAALDARINALTPTAKVDAASQPIVKEIDAQVSAYEDQKNQISAEIDPLSAKIDAQIEERNNLGLQQLEDPTNQGIQDQILSLNKSIEDNQQTLTNYQTRVEDLTVRQNDLTTERDTIATSYAGLPVVSQTQYLGGSLTIVQGNDPNTPITDNGPGVQTDTTFPNDQTIAGGGFGPTTTITDLTIAGGGFGRVDYTGSSAGNTMLTSAGQSFYLDNGTNSNETSLSGLPQVNRLGYENRVGLETGPSFSASGSMTMGDFNNEGAKNAQVGYNSEIGPITGTDLPGSSTTFTSPGLDGSRNTVDTNIGLELGFQGEQTATNNFDRGSIDSTAAGVGLDRTPTYEGNALPQADSDTAPITGNSSAPEPGSAAAAGSPGGGGGGGGGC